MPIAQQFIRAAAYIQIFREFKIAELLRVLRQTG